MYKCCSGVFGLDFNFFVLGFEMLLCLRPEITRGSDPLRRTRPERSVGHGFIFSSPDSIGSVRVRIKPDPTRGQPYATFMAFFPHSLLTPHSNYSPKQNVPSFIISTSCILLYIYYRVYTINIKNQNIELKPRTQKPIPHKERETERESLKLSNPQSQWKNAWESVWKS